MKKIAILILCAAAALTACQKSLLVPAEEQAGKKELTFKIDVQCDDDSRVAKTDWTYGDKIYIFFDKEFLPEIPTMDISYGPSGWSVYISQECKDSLANRTSGTLSAVYVPYWGSVGIGLNWEQTGYFLSFDDQVWSPAYEYQPYAQPVYSYFMTCEDTPYTITDGVLSITLTMRFPADKDFVHFFIPNLAGNGVNPGRYQLETSPAIPAMTVDGLTASGFTASSIDYIPGYEYAGGYSFCGVLPAGLKGVSQDYTLIVRDVQTDHKYSYSVSGKTLTRGSAIQLPELAYWTDEGTEVEAKPMYASNGKVYYFATKNLGARRPTEPGMFFAWGETTGYTLKEVMSLGMHQFSENQYAFRVSGSNDDITFSRYVPATAPAAWGGAGAADDMYRLVPGDDAACQMLGMPWMTPSIDELNGLISNCDWEYDSSNFGFTVTGRGDYASSQIFIPLTDNISYGSYFITGKRGSLMTNNLHFAGGVYDPLWVDHISFTGGDNIAITTGYHRRYMGFNIRPVKVVPAS